MIIYSYGILLDLCRMFIWSAISQKLLHMQKEILWDFPFGIGKIAIQLTNKIREFNFVHTHLGHAHAKMTLSQAPSALLQPLPMVLFLLLFRSKLNGQSRKPLLTNTRYHVNFAQLERKDWAKFGDDALSVPIMCSYIFNHQYFFFFLKCKLRPF